MKPIEGYPSPLAPETEKDSKEYGLQYFRAMHRDWAGESDSLLTPRKYKWQNARNYAGGTQSQAKYKDQLNVSGDMSYMNLDWRIVPIIPKFIDIIVNSLTNADYLISASAIDPVAVNKRKADELRMKTNMLLKEPLLEMQQQSGVPLIDNNEFIPVDNEEFELFMQMTYKQAVEIAIEEGIALAMSINDWKETARRIIRDLVVIGIGAAKTEVTDQGVIIRYVDPMNLVTSYSTSPDYQNMIHAGELRRITLSALKAEAGNEISDEQYQEIENYYKSKTNLGGHDTGYGSDGTLIEVIDGQFIVPIELSYEKKDNRFGSYSVHKKPAGYKSPTNSTYKRELLKGTYQCKYIGKYVVGSDVIYQYGKAKNQIRPKSNLAKTRLDYIVYAPDLDFMVNQSLCERMIPFGDQIQLIHLKLQHLAAKARPKGMALEVGSLENVPKGKGGTFTPLELQDIYDQTGTLYYRFIADDGTPTQARSIQELEGGVGNALQELLSLYQHNLSMLRDVTGINEARDGSVPDKDSVVGVAKLNLLASNNATRAINDAYLNIYRRTAESAVLMIQDLVYYNKPYRGYVSALGDLKMKAIEITKDVSLHEFGIVIEALPNEVEKERLERDIQSSLDQKELRLEDAIMLRSVKNIKLANQLLIYRRKKYFEEQMAINQQNSQNNAQQQQVSIQQKFEADKGMKELQAQIDNMKLQEEYKLKDWFAEREHERKMEEIALTVSGKYVPPNQTLSPENNVNMPPQNPVQ